MPFKGVPQLRQTCPFPVGKRALVDVVLPFLFFRSRLYKFRIIAYILKCMCLLQYNYWASIVTTSQSSRRAATSSAMAVNVAKNSADLTSVFIHPCRYTTWKETNM